MISSALLHINEAKKLLDKRTIRNDYPDMIVSELNKAENILKKMEIKE